MTASVHRRDRVPDTQGKLSWQASVCKLAVPTDACHGSSWTRSWADRNNLVLPTQVRTVIADGNFNSRSISN